MKQSSRSFRQLRQFRHGINSDEVFGTHRVFAAPAQGRFWPHSDLPVNQRVCRLLEGMRTRYARRDIFRV